MTKTSNHLKPKNSAICRNRELQDWLHLTPLGREILRKERKYFVDSAKYIFGNYSLQIGLEQTNLLQGNKIINHYTICQDAISDVCFLPFADDSLDLIVCPHVLEFYPNNYPHIIAELQRVLKPDGQLIISCFNRSSWLNLFKRRFTLFKNIPLLRIDEIKNQLQKCDLTIEGGKFFSYIPPFASARKIHNWRWLNKVGDRWFPTLANSFCLIARKNVAAPTNIIKVDFETNPNLQPQLGNAKVCHKN